MPNSDTLTASCVIPDPLLVKVDFQRDPIIPNEFVENPYFVRWPQTVGTVSYFALFILSIRDKTNNPSRGVRHKLITVESGPLQPDCYTDADAVQGFFRSRNSVELRPLRIQSDGDQTYKLIVLNRTDELYYRYHKKLQNITATRSNPFAEPDKLPTNIRGGYGVFAGYNQLVYKVNKLP